MKLTIKRSALIASCVLGLCLNAKAEMTTYSASWSGSSFSNSASAYASFKLDTDYLSAPGVHFNGGSLPLWISDIDLTVTGASSGNGHFTTSDFQDAFFYSDGTLDFAQQLVGQSGFYDFNLRSYLGAPNGRAPIVLTAGDPGENMALTSLSTVSAVPEPSSQLALIALGSAGLLTRRRTQRSA